MLNFLRSLSILFLCACSSKKNENTLVMLTSADNPPYGFFNSKDGKMEGFEIDLAQEIAKRMNMKIEIKDSHFSSLISALQNGKGDFVMAALSKTEERAKAVDFSENYYQSIPAFLSSKVFEGRTYEDLNGKKVGVQLGSVYETTLKNLMVNNPKFKVELLALTSIGELIQELKKGKIDGLITEGVVAQNYVKDGFFSLPLMGLQVDSYSAAFPKGSVVFQKFNDTVKTLKKEGFIDKLAQKWFTLAATKVAMQ